MGSDVGGWSGPEILGVAEHAALDELAEASGVSISDLMENAGRQVANEIARWWPPQKTIVVCGPGNNGGDGYVVARHLRARGYPVDVLTVGDGSKASAAALDKRALWQGPLRRWTSDDRPGEALIVDAAFGAGLTRPIPPELARYYQQAGDIVAIDVPSGLHGDTARFLGDDAWRASATVTFVRRKPAHVLMPGREYCGPVTVCDIGMPEHLIDALAEAAGEGAIKDAVFAYENVLSDPLPEPGAQAHKYDRGHCVTVAGPALSTGAARLSARAALRIGAGLVTLAASPDAALVCAHHVTAEMVRSFDGAAGLASVLSDPRKNAVVIGPGLGRGADTQDLVAAVLKCQAGVVLDADALSIFENQPDALFGLIRGKPGGAVTMTPHEGEFERLFPGLRKRAVNKIEAARMAADMSRAVVVLKGPDTVIAHPQGQVRVNWTAPRWLATAGSGDVLAGLVGGLIAQGKPAFEAASMAVAVHSWAGRLAGRGLIATDLLDVLPKVIQNLAYKAHMEL